MQTRYVVQINSSFMHQLIINACISYLYISVHATGVNSLGNESQIRNCEASSPLSCEKDWKNGYWTVRLSSIAHIRSLRWALELIPVVISQRCTEVSEFKGELWLAPIYHIDYTEFITWMYCWWSRISIYKMRTFLLFLAACSLVLFFSLRWAAFSGLFSSSSNRSAFRFSRVCAMSRRTWWYVTKNVEPSLFSRILNTSFPSCISCSGRIK